MLHWRLRPQKSIFVVLLGASAFAPDCRIHAFAPLPQSKGASNGGIVHRSPFGSLTQHGPQRYIHTPTWQYLSSLGQPDDGNEDENNNNAQENASIAPLDDDLFDFLASKAAAVNEPKSESNPEGRQRRRDRMKQFLSNRLGGIVSGSGDGGGNDLVEPIRIDGIEGMPSIDDILSEETSTFRAAAASDFSASTATASDKESKLTDDPSDVAQIDAAVFQFKSEVRQRLTEQRKSDPSSVPVNAEEFLDRVIEEIREYNMAEAREARAQDDIRAYEKEQLRRSEEEAKGRSASEDALVMEILGEAKGDADAAKAEEEEMQTFREYERSLREQVEAADIGADTGEDIDVQALRIMENLYDKRSEEPEEWDEDFQEWDTDNLEDGIHEIKAAIEEKAKDAAGKKVRPEDMKEWVMYRSIATRMAKETGQSEVDEEDVKAQLESWKEFQAREEEMRRSAGLTKGARMPFPWVDRLEQDDDDENAADSSVTKPVDRRHPDDIRMDYDKQALQVLTDLMSKTTDPTRQEKLRGEIDALKVDIHELEKAIFERGPWTPPVEEPVEEELKGPVDISDILGASPYVEGDEPSPSSFAEAPPPAEPSNDFAPPPDTPFFSDSFEEDAAVDEELPAVPPPDTPFFSSASDEDDIDASDNFSTTPIEDNSESGDEDVKSLGSLEEQKFRSMTRRAGVRSQAGEEELKRQWEEYLKAEQAMRDRTGLSGGDDPSLLRSKVDYNVDDVVKEGGDVDADAILASIGQRPSKQKKGSNDSSTGPGAGPSAAGGTKTEESDAEYQQFLQYERERAAQAQQQQEAAASGSAPEVSDVEASEAGTDVEEEDVIVYHKHSTTWDKTSISDQLYRSLSPEGSLKDDPEAKGKDKAAFEEYLRKEQEMRQQVESIDVPEADVMGKVSFSDEDGESTGASAEFLDLEKVDNYVDNALDSIGPRPEIRKRKRSSPDFARDYSGAGFDEDDDGEEDGNDDMPEWVKIERRQEEDRKKAALDSDADDDYLDDFDYDEKERQAAEFERETSTSTDIDIGSILGRDYFGPGDEPDDFYSLDKGRGSSFSSFEKRKKALLEYTELSVAELNSLIEYKESETPTGASRYLKKVRQPYREFGAIFRLEGLLVDTTGMQWEAWKKTAEKHELEMPKLEEVRTASAHRAPFAIQRIFYWTDDIVETRDIAKTHSDALKTIFSDWMEENGVTYTPPQGPKSFDLFGVEDDVVKEEGAHVSEPTEKQTQSQVIEDVESSDAPQPSESDFIGMQFRSWKKASESFGYSEPTVDEMQVAMYTGPEDAISKAFGWTSDSAEISKIIAVYRDAFRQETDLWAQQHQPDDVSRLKKKAPSSETAQDAPTTQQDDTSDGLTKEDVAEMQLFAWSTAAESHGLNVPSLEEIQLASWVSPEEAIERVYKWPVDAQNIPTVVSTYRAAMKKITDIYIQKKNIKVAKAKKEATSENTAPRAPTQDDIVKLQLEAWSQTANKYGHDAPSIDDIQLAAFAGPDEAVRRVFKWTDDAEKAVEIIASYRASLKTLSDEFMRLFGQTKVVASASASNTEEDEEDNLPFFQLQDGAVDWIESLMEVEMPCAVVSHLEQEQLDVIIESTGLDKLFPPDKRVSATNYYASQSQEFLGAALRLERRPDYCAVFDTTPSSSAAAHEVDMQSVSKIGCYKNYDLLSADLTFKYFAQLQTQVLRGLFTETKLDEPQTEIQDIKPETRQTTTKTRFWEEGDR